MPYNSDSTETFAKLKRSISSAEFPVYYLYGDEPFYIDLLQKEAETLLPPGQKDFNFDLFYGADSDPQKVLSVVRSFPMMAEKRVVIVRDFLQMKGQGGLDPFKDYFQNPNPTTLLFIAETSFPDRRTSLGKSITASKKYVKTAIFDRLPDHKLSGWVIEWTAGEFQKSIDARAAHMLAQLVGNQLRLLAAEIEKICLFTAEKKEITFEDVKKIVGHYREYTTFELKEAIFQRDVTKALLLGRQILSQSQSDPGELIRTISFMNSIFRDLWQITRLKSRGMSKDQVQKALDIHPRIFYHKWREASSYRFDEIPFVFEALLDADQALKGHSTLDPASILLMLIRRITGQQQTMTQK